MFVETLQRPEIQEVEEQRGGDQQTRLLLHLPWEILAGAGAGCLLAALLLLVAVLCRRRHSGPGRRQDQQLLPPSREEESSLQAEQLESGSSLGLRPAAAVTMAEDKNNKSSNSSSPDLIPHRDPGIVVKQGFILSQVLSVYIKAEGKSGEI